MLRLKRCVWWHRAKVHRLITLGRTRCRARRVYVSFGPKEFDEIIYTAYTKNNKAGCFRLGFSSNHWALSLAASASRFNSRYCRGGDQSLFIQKKLFNTLNGFNEEYIICEDGELIDRIYKHHSFCVLPQKVITSSRRFTENGPGLGASNHGF